MKNAVLILVLSLFAGTSLLCTGLSNVAVTPGSGQETTNGIFATAVNSDGTPAVGASVRLRKNDYVSGLPTLAKRFGTTFTNIKTDKNGKFGITDVDSGCYAIEINNSQYTVLLLCTLGVHDTVNFGTAALAHYATITGKVDSLLGTAYVQVLGLERLVKVDAHGNFTIADLPAGSLDLRVATSNSLFTEIAKVNTVSGETTSVVASAQLRFAKSIVLNTAANGADITETILNFPVLVRLTSANFDFSQTMFLGQDIRFCKDDKTYLPYEIELWDSVAHQALIWVKIDTVFGQNSTQHITMLWGNEKSLPATSGSDVFKVAEGFSAVWHLNQSVNDATSNKFDGTNYGTTDARGAIGDCKQFNGKDSIKIAGLLGQPGCITLSAWVRLDNVADSGCEIISLGDCVLLRADDNRSINPGVMASYNYASSGITHSDVSSKQFIAGAGWHYCAMTLDTIAKKEMLYIDGIVVSSETITLPILYTNLGANTFIGRHGNKRSVYNFSGSIDEVRVSHVALSPQWNKLSFMNQRPDGDRLIQMK